MGRPAVSVIIPTYNYARFVTEAVDSVLAQTYGDLEVIVVDDGSTDDTPERMKTYGDRVRYIRQANQGPSATRNNGIEAARGDLIAFLDADDVWHPGKLRAQMSYLEAHPDVALLATDCTLELPQPWPALPACVADTAVDVGLDELVIHSRFGICGVVIRRKCLDAAGLFDASLRAAEDRDLWLRIASRFRIAKLCLPLWWYRFHESNSSYAAARMEANERDMLVKAFRELDGLRGRRLLKRRARSYAAFAAALMYDEARMPWVALWRLLQSFLLFPLPHRRRDVNVPLVRAKRTLLILGRLTRDWGRQPALASAEKPCGC